MPPKEKSYEEKVESRLRYYKSSGSHKGKTDAELRTIAEDSIKLSALLSELEITDQFEDQTEKDRAEELARKYFKDYTFEYVSDKNTLKQLIFLEMLNERLQRSLNEFYKDAQSVPVQMMDGLHKNLIQIIELKKILGLTKSDKDSSSSDAGKALDLLKKKFRVWRQNNQGSRTLVCPHCSKMVMLKIRTDAWDAHKHPFFQDRWLTNPHLFALLDAGKLTISDVAKVLDTSEDYILWIRNKIAPNKSIKQLNIDLKQKADITTQENSDKSSAIAPTIEEAEIVESTPDQTINTAPVDPITSFISNLSKKSE